MTAPTAERLSYDFAAGRLELRSVGFSLERRTRHACGRTILNLRRNRKVVRTKVRVSREVFGEHRVLAVCRAARKQIAALQTGRHDIETSPWTRSRRRRRSGTTATS